MKTVNEARRDGLRGLRDRYPRLWALPTLMVMGGIGAVVHALNERTLWAIWSVAVSTLLGLFFALSKSEYAGAAMGEGDERQLAINLEAGFYAYLALGLSVAAGVFWEVFHGRIGIFVVMSFIGVATYATAFAVLRRRR